MIFAFAHATPVGAATPEDRCLSALRKGYAKVAVIEEKESARCLASAAKGTLGFPPNLTACIADDPRGKIARVAAKALRTEISSCSAESLPAFALPSLDGNPWEPTDAASFSGVMTEAARTLDGQLHALLLGGDPDSAVFLHRSVNSQTPGARINPIAAKCQSTVVTTVQKCVTAKLAAFDRCAAASLRAGSDGASLVADCLANPAGGQPDPSGGIKRLCESKVEKMLDRRCLSRNIDLGATFPGASICAGSAEEWATCIDKRVDCAVCESLEVATGLGITCDLFDDATTNQSCEPLPTPTPTATPSPVPTATPTPALEVDLEGFLPQLGGPGSEPFTRLAVSEEEEVISGIGIRLNGDDDDADNLPDHSDAIVVNENDLIEVRVTVVGLPADSTLQLARSAASLRLWSNATKGTGVLVDEDSVTLALPTGETTLFAELVSMNTADLTVSVVDTMSGNILASDVLRFRPFTSLVIGLDGEFLTPTDPPSGLNSGIAEMSIVLRMLGYDAHMYAENVVDPTGAGELYDEIVSAVQERGVTELACIGFSHGGGSCHDVLAKLKADGIEGYTVPYTAYIDAISNASDLTILAEERLPPDSSYHVNFFQTNLLTPLWIWGTSIPGSAVDVNVNNTPWGSGVLHITITQVEEVQLGILLPLIAEVSR